MPDVRRAWLQTAKPSAGLRANGFALLPIEAGARDEGKIVGLRPKRAEFFERWCFGNRLRHDQQHLAVQAVSLHQKFLQLVAFNYVATFSEAHPFFYNLHPPAQ